MKTFYFFIFKNRDHHFGDDTFPFISCSAIEQYVWFSISIFFFSFIFHLKSFGLYSDAQFQVICEYWIRFLLFFFSKKFSLCKTIQYSRSNKCVTLHESCIVNMEYTINEHHYVFSCFMVKHQMPSDSPFN